MYRRPWPPLNPYAMRYLPPGTQPQGPFGPPVFRPSAPRFPVPPPYGLGPPVHSFQRTLNQWPQRGISHQPLIQRPAISETTSLNLTVQTSSDFSVVNRWNSWLAETEHRLLAHRQCTRKGVPSLPEIRARFLQWKQLIEMLRSARSDACESNNLAYETELTQLETECSASDLVNCIRRRVRQVAKKRRYKSRVRKRQQELNDDGVVVLRTSTLSVLERLRNCPSPKHHSSQPRKHDPSTIAKTQRTPVKRLHRPTATSSEVIRIKQALSECRERLALLDSLERLRAARISQARQRGGLFPEAFDRAFSAQFNEIRSILRTQLKKLMDVEKTQNVTSSQGIVKEQQNPDNSMSLCCDHWPDLPTAWKQVLFHASETPQGVPWRWTRFYHQADFDFADFLRIRTTWDSYLVQSTNAEQASGDAAEKTPASVLPDSWDLPIDLETMNTAWRSFISFDSETTASSA